MQRKIVSIVLLFFMIGGIGCSSSQTLKNAWKGTRSFWYSTVNVPASIDYDDSGSLSKYEELLARSAVGIDKELIALEKHMSNADRSPTPQWVRSLMDRFSWLSGFTMINAEQAMVFQFPGPPIKALDFHPLFKEDPKQNRRSMRGYVQDTPMGPEILLATPVYDAQTLRGLVSVYFDIRNLLKFSESPDELIIIAPNAILWPGKYNFQSTPMAGIQWDTILLEANSGTVRNAAGVFYWNIRYLGNIPLIFAVPVQGSFGDNTPSRTGPTSKGPYPEVKPLKMPPPPPAIVPPVPVPAQQQRRVVRRRVLMPTLPRQLDILPTQPAQKRQAVPRFSPFQDPAAQDPAVKTPASSDDSGATPTPSPSIAPKPTTDGAQDTQQPQTAPAEKPEAETPKTEESSGTTPAAPTAPGRLSPFGPQ